MINLHEIEKKINDVDTLQIFTTDLDVNWGVNWTLIGVKLK